MGILFDGFGVIFSLMFFLVLGVFLFVFITGICRWNKNNHAPRLTVAATVAAKRPQVTHHHNGDNMMGATHTSYYVTFQVESGDRMELSVSGAEYGLLVEGDSGRLTFQGTRYLGFDRG